MGDLLQTARRLVALGALLLAAGCANAPVDPTRLPEKLQLRQGTKLPLAAGIGIYLPAGVVQADEVFQNQLLQRGRFTREAVDAVSRAFFKTVVHYDQPTADPIRWMLVLHPKWSAEAAKLKLEMNYRLLDSGGQQVDQGARSDLLPLDNNAPNVVLTNLVIKVMQRILVDVVNGPASAVAGQTTTVANMPAEKLIDAQSPHRVGSGFYISAEGQAVTAASLVQQCLRIDVIADGQAPRAARLGRSSSLLNLAVLETGVAATTALAVSPDSPALGAGTTTVSFQRGKDKDTPTTRTLSFGNVVSFDAAAGAFGALQFSTATRPSSVAAPLLGPDGRLVGVYSGIYPYDYLHRRNLLPANTFQALKVEYLTRFLSEAGVSFTTDAYADARPAVERATAAAVQVACYQ